MRLFTLKELLPDDEDSEPVGMVELDLSYIRDLIRKDVKYRTNRSKKRDFTPREGSTDADATMIARRTHLHDSIDNLLGRNHK